MKLHQQGVAATLVAVTLASCTHIPDQQVVAATSATVALASTADGIKSPLLCDGAMRYRPMPAFPATNYSDHRLTAEKQLEAVTTTFPTDNGEINKLLPNIASAISVDQIDGSVDIGPFVSSRGKQQRITIDFMKYRSEPVQDSSGKIYLYSRVGAGVRLTIDIVTSDTTLSAGSLIAIAASARAGLTKGSISVDVIGMDASDITLAVPFTSDLSGGSIQSIIEALAVVKSKLHESSTKLSPQFIARIECVVEKPAKGKA